MSDTKKEMRITIVSYEQFSEYTFIPPATFFVMNSLQEYYFFHTSKREEAQAEADNLFGKGKYTVKASKNQNTRSRLESGGYSCVGHNTRKGQKKYN